MRGPTGGYKCTPTICQTNFFTPAFPDLTLKNNSDIHTQETEIILAAMHYYFSFNGITYEQ